LKLLRGIPGEVLDGIDTGLALSSSLHLDQAALSKLFDVLGKLGPTALQVLHEGVIAWEAASLLPGVTQENAVEELGIS
jgi:hypothetical protein